MESSGNVSSDAQEIASKLSDYSGIVSGLGGFWKGDSHDHLLTEAEAFCDEYVAIATQLNNYAAACTTYEYYKSTKKDLSDAEYEYANASAESKGTIQQTINSLSTNLTNYKNSILGYLRDASSKKFSATTLSGVNIAISSGVAAQNKAFVESLRSEVGNTISNYPNLGFHDGLWCADFASQMLIENGYNIPRCSVAGDGTASYDIFYALRNNGATVHLDTGASYMGYSDSSEYDPSYSPQPGDVVLFNWDYDGSTDHVGFVLQDNGDGTITTIEGNTSGDAGSSCVAIKSRDRDLVYGYATPVPQTV